MQQFFDFRLIDLSLEASQVKEAKQLVEKVLEHLCALRVHVPYYPIWLTEEPLPQRGARCSFRVFRLAGVKIASEIDTVGEKILFFLPGEMLIQGGLVKARLCPRFKHYHIYGSQLVSYNWHEFVTSEVIRGLLA